MFLSDTTTDALVQVYTYTDNGEGVHFFGGIKNTGATNSMSVKITTVDKWGDTDNFTYVVLPTTKLSFDTMLSANSTTQPPYASITLEVKSTAAGQSTTFDMYLVLN